MLKNQSGTHPDQNQLGKPQQYGLTVGANSMEITPNRPENIRNRLVIQNTGTGNLWLCFGAFAKSGACLLLLPGKDLVLEKGDNFSGQITGVSDTSTTAAVTEFLL